MKLVTAALLALLALSAQAAPVKLEPGPIATAKDGSLAFIVKNTLSTYGMITGMVVRDVSPEGKVFDAYVAVTNETCRDELVELQVRDASDTRIGASKFQSVKRNNDTGLGIFATILCDAYERNGK